MPGLKTDLTLVQRQVDDWNQRNNIGTSVVVKGYEGLKTTRTEAMILFDQKGVIYLEGYNGYFDLADVAVANANSKEPSTAGRADSAFLFPGQGSQELGMGAKLFDMWPDLVARANEILGYSIRELCIEDRQGRLKQTEFTQPALFTVNALAFLEQSKNDRETQPAFFLGHSLGEYNALFAAGVFDFETGLRLVKERGALMAEARGGGMAAIIGMNSEQVMSLLQKEGLVTIDVANINTPEQTVISGLADEITKSLDIFQACGAKLCIPLNVSGAFHSRYMKEAQLRFRKILDQTIFMAPSVPVISNVTAKPHELHEIARRLSDQLISPVRWVESIEYIASFGVTNFIEIGPGKVLSQMIRQILK